MTPSATQSPGRPDRHAVAAPSAEPQTRHETTPQLLGRSAVEAYTEVFRALSEPMRVEILSLIASSADEYPCTQLETELPLSKSTISYHIKILSGAGLISVRKSGRYYFYRAHRDTIDFFVPGFLEQLAAERRP